MIPALNIAYALLGSIGITGILTIAFIILLNKAKGKGWWNLSPSEGLLEAIRSMDEFPSLANLQLFMWSVIIVFAFKQMTSGKSQ